MLSGGLLQLGKLRSALSGDVIHVRLGKPVLGLRNTEGVYKGHPEEHGRAKHINHLRTPELAT